MAFTEQYIRLCYEHRTIYRNKRRIKGDWYCNLQTGQIKIYDGESEAELVTPPWFYSPDMDDLLEFLHLQIRSCQETDRPARSIVIKFTPDKKWQVEIALENGMIHKSVNGESAHVVLLNAIYAMSAFVVTERVPRRTKDEAGNREENNMSTVRPASTLASVGGKSTTERTPDFLPKFWNALKKIGGLLGLK